MSFSVCVCVCVCSRTKNELLERTRHFQDCFTTNETVVEK